jgi:hypothetical protein
MEEMEMRRRMLKGALAVAVGAAALAASPAIAGTVVTYYAPNGYILGYKVYCDSGALYGTYGDTSSPLYDSHYIALAC